ncbi:MAG TPA: UDP-N-acetylmuramoyl-L-alanyl-D-glutamate--2,6-diaminopimelate ligase [Spirochaetia bacterium]|nr:UDP-N-acetylmuramoyl-L-alanyl-D-glutamate--2,6-diaminopimelate ligase [Spirochaetia bacterium]
MRLTGLLSNINVLEYHGPRDADITGLAYDSRKVKEGFLFFALPGIHADGHDFIEAAIGQGARAVIHSRSLSTMREGIAYLRVEDPRIVMSPVSAEFYGHPSQELTIVGVTGTDGKSTTVSLIHQLLEAKGFKAGFLSTVQYQTTSVRSNPYRQSTPEATEVQAILREMLDSGCQYGVIEATSHGLSHRNNRLGDVDFDVAVFTNVTHEHLEFHGSLEQYRNDKANLFRALDHSLWDGAFGVVNRDDPNADLFIHATKKKVRTYSLKDPHADFFADRIETSLGSGGTNGGTFFGTKFVLHEGGRAHNCTISLPGSFNVENVMASILAVSGLLDCPVSELIPFLPALKPVKGRMNAICKGQPFTLIVDYAHTPAAFEKLFPMMRKTTEGRLIVVFGSAGERDTEKRSLQGAIASRYADLMILTDEDPRGEDSLSIIREIASGCPERKEGRDLLMIPDRREAILTACSRAEPKDTVLLLGKGHESTIIYADGPIPWDEIKAAEEALASLGYRG